MTATATLTIATIVLADTIAWTVAIRNKVWRGL